MAIIDIDHFKKINDTYGHVCGDEVLKHIVKTMQENIRETDTLTRIGGEEFILILTDTDLEEGKKIVERIRKQVESSPYIYKGKIIEATISLGLTQYKEGSLENLIKKIDQALYQAKESGRNKLIVV